MVLEVKNLSKKTRNRALLQNISFSIAAGEIVSLVGPDRAGKSALLRILSHLAFPDSGSVAVCGADLWKNTKKALSRLFFFPGRPALYHQLTGKEHLQLAVLHCEKPERLQLEEVLAANDLLGCAGKRTSNFSLPEKWRLQLAMCQLSKPGVLLLEEPREKLDPETEERLCTLVTMLAEQGTGVLAGAGKFGPLQRASSSFLSLQSGVLEGKLPPDDFRVAAALEQLGGGL